jgi:hypothetical protein
MTHPTWTNAELQSLLTQASERCGHVPLRKGWQRIERELQAVYAFIAELYAHDAHVEDARVYISYKSNNWQVCMNTGRSEHTYYSVTGNAIYNSNALIHITKLFIKLCEKEHDTLYPPQSAEEELRDRLAAAAIPNLPHILRDYEIKRKDRAQ